MEALIPIAEWIDSCREVCLIANHYAFRHRRVNSFGGRYYTSAKPLDRPCRQRWSFILDCAPEARELDWYP
jgi:hypothetical protein